MKKSQTTLVSRVAEHVHSIYARQDLLLGGAQLSKNNRIILCRFFESWLYLVEDLMIRQGHSPTARSQRASNFVTAFLKNDVGDVLSFLDSVFFALIEETQIDKFFNRICHLAELSHLTDYKRLISPVNLAMSSCFTDDRERRAYWTKTVAQFLKFGRKLNFEAIGLEEDALVKYLETEERLSTVIPLYDNEMLNELSLIMKEWLKDFHLEDLKPNHGPGSVAEGSLTTEMKFMQLGSDSLLREVLSGRCHDISWMEFYPAGYGTKGTQRVSRTIFVPKTFSKLRTISMEPVSLQYIQQGVMKEIYRYIANHPFLGVRINLEDQGQNQIYALEGSKYHTFGTIDLSAASDSVTWELAKQIFKRCPQLLKWLLATRSRGTLLPNGDTIALKKFAPMGSALCFPIQCLIFCAIIEYSLRQYRRSVKRVSGLYSVYGDDLIVPSYLYDTVVSNLQKCGFVVNVEKSYNQGEYRESCGKEYYAGFDISVLYYRTPFYKKRVSPSAYSSWCSAANNAFLHRLPTYRSYLIDKILQALPGKHPYFGRSPLESPTLFSSFPTNFHAKAWYSTDWQEMVGRFVVVKSKRRGEELEDDTLRYFVKLVEMSWRSSGPPSHVDESPSTIALRGCIEFFNSILRPVTPPVVHNLQDAEDWSGIGR